MSYTTQMDAARKGILTKEMKAVAEKENFDPQELMRPRRRRQGGHPGQQTPHLS